MTTYGCQLCGKFYTPIGSQQQIAELLRGVDNFPCITPLCPGRLVKSQFAFKTTATPMPLERFFQAVNGFGFNEGILAEYKHVCELLKNKRIVQVVGESAGEPERTIITKFVLEDGTRLHLGASSLGACIYRIEEPGKEPSNGYSHLPVADNGSSTTEVGEEAGRSSQPDQEAGGSSTTRAELYPPGVPTLQPDSGVLPGEDRQPQPGSRSDVRMYNTTEPVQESGRKE